MTKDEAHKLLDGLKNGVSAPDWKINEALIETGDLAWSESAYQVVRRAGTWERKQSRTLAKAGPWDGLAA